MIARLYANRIASGVVNAKTRKQEEVAALLIADGHAELVPTAQEE